MLDLARMLRNGSIKTAQPIAICIKGSQTRKARYIDLRNPIVTESEDSQYGHGFADGEKVQAVVV